MIRIRVRSGFGLQVILAIGLSLSSRHLVFDMCPTLCLSVGLSVCLSVRKVYYGITVKWIQMPLGMVSGVGRWVYY